LFSTLQSEQSQFLVKGLLSRHLFLVKLTSLALELCLLGGEGLLMGLDCLDSIRQLIKLYLKRSLDGLFTLKSYRCGLQLVHNNLFGLGSKFDDLLLGVLITFLLAVFFNGVDLGSYSSCNFGCFNE